MRNVIRVCVCHVHWHLASGFCKRPDSNKYRYGGDGGGGGDVGQPLAPVIISCIHYVCAAAFRQGRVVPGSNLKQGHDNVVKHAQYDYRTSGGCTRISFGVFTYTHAHTHTHTNIS